MRSGSRWARRVIVAAAVVCVAAQTHGGAVGAECSAERPAPMAATDPALCESLERVIRQPSALPLPDYERKLDAFFGHYCHRNAASGWVRDKRVRDTGPGISAGDHGRVFERFHRVEARPERPGTGLGLPIAREIARAHGGSIELESAAGAGAIFTVHLPREEGRGAT